MDMKKAMQERHTVRRYTDKPISREAAEQLARLAEGLNMEHGTAIELRTGDSRAFGALTRLVLAKGVHNYFLMAGEERPGLDEALGFCGAELMLSAQALGLNTWWAGGTFNRRLMEELAPGKRVAGVIAVGYGRTPGVPHRSKTPGQVSAYEGDAPEWFKEGGKAALLAPTALNRQGFMLTGSGRRVELRCENGIFSGVDAGLVKYHFELGAGTENFEWV